LEGVYVIGLAELGMALSNRLLITPRGEGEGYASCLENVGYGR
jgi:hypothetical protein